MSQPFFIPKIGRFFRAVGDGDILVDYWFKKKKFYQNFVSKLAHTDFLAGNFNDAERKRISSNVWIRLFKDKVGK